MCLPLLYRRATDPAVGHRHVLAFAEHEMVEACEYIHQVHMGACGCGRCLDHNQEIGLDALAILTSCSLVSSASHRSLPPLYVLLCRNLKVVPE